MIHRAGILTLTFLASCASRLPADTPKSGPQPGARVPGIFHPTCVFHAVHADQVGKPVNLMCHYGPNPTVMVFARETSPDLVKLVKHLDSEVEKLKPFRLASCVVLLTDDKPPVAENKLHALREQAKSKHVTLTYFPAAGPPAYNIADEAEWTVLLYRRYNVAANHTLRKVDLGDRAIDRVLMDVDAIVPPASLPTGCSLAPGETLALRVPIRRDRLQGQVTIRLTDLPRGLTAREVIVPADKSEGALVLVAGKEAQQCESVGKAVLTAGAVRMESKVSISVRTIGR